MAKFKVCSDQTNYSLLHISKPYYQFEGTVSKASEKRIFRDLLSRLIDQIEEPAPGFA
jgi:hypothetical protein